jgi:hypothetical protein
MSTTPIAPERRRVRHQAREAAAVMATSVAMSLAFAAVLLVLSRLGSQG